jgi:copper chaperone CopZ
MENNQKITVEIKTVYGVENVYPVCDKAKAFASIAGTKTLTAHTIQSVKALGYAIEVKSNIPSQL